MPNKLGALIWLAANDDPEFLLYPEIARVAMLAHIMQMPFVLAELLDQPASVENIITAQKLFVESCRAAQQLELEMVVDLQSVVPDHLYAVLRYASDHLEEVLITLGLTTAELMDRIPFNVAARRKLATGTMTIKDVLLLQPMLIIDPFNKTPLSS